MPAPPAVPPGAPRARRLAILGFSGDRAFLKSALSAQEKDWLDACLTVSPAELQPAQRHNLPAWLAGPLLARLGQASFDALAEAYLAGVDWEPRADVEARAAALLPGLLLARVPGCYFNVGNGTDETPGEGGCPVHNAGYDFNDRVLGTGATYWVRLTEAWLKA